MFTPCMKSPHMSLTCTNECIVGRARDRYLRLRVLLDAKEAKKAIGSCVTYMT